MQEGTKKPRVLSDPFADLPTQHGHWQYYRMSTFVSHADGRDWGAEVEELLSSGIDW